MALNRRGSATVQYPSELEIVRTRDFDAPAGLLFEVLTKPEYVSRWCATGPDRVTTCEIDLRVTGDFHIVFVTSDGVECSFRGSYLEIDPPRRLVNTWLFEGWPGAWAVETNELSEVDGLTRLTQSLAFRDRAGREHMVSAEREGALSGEDNGPSASFDAMEDVLAGLLT